MEKPDFSEHQNVSILRIESVGNYAIRIVFDDGHNTGIYSWEYYMRWAQNSKLFKPIANNMLCFFKNRDLLKTLRPIFLKVDKKINCWKTIYLNCVWIVLINFYQ